MRSITAKGNSIALTLRWRKKWHIQNLKECQCGRNKKASRITARNEPMKWAVDTSHIHSRYLFLEQ